MEFNFLSHLVAKTNGRDIPLWGQFELLPVCNLRCPMCYIHNPVEDNQGISKLLPATFWIDIARQAVDAGMLVLSITGGEPLLYPEFDLLLEAISRMGIIVSLNTNGTLIDERQVERLAEYALAKINLTLYGGSDETYGKVTGLRDGFSRVSKAIDLLQATGQNVYLNGVLNPENQDDLPKMMKFAESKGLVLHETAYLFPRRDRYSADATKVQDYDPNNFRLTPQDAAMVSSKYYRVLNGEVSYRQSAAIAVYRDRAISELSKCFPRKGVCRAGYYEFAVNWRGYMQPCILLPVIQEDLCKRSFDEAWNICKNSMKELPFAGKCSTCSHLDICPVCPASIYLETGTHDQAPEYLCRFSEELLKIWEHDSEGIQVHARRTDMVPISVNFRGCDG